MFLYGAGAFGSTITIGLIWIVLGVGAYLYSNMKYYETKANYFSSKIETLQKELEEQGDQVSACNQRVILSGKQLEAVRGYYKKSIPFVISGEEPGDDKIFEIEPR
jgi:hypothetical protein